MRRAILAVALGGVLVTAGACSSDAKSKPVTAAPAPSATPSLPPMPDYTANTRLVCGKLQKIFDADLRGFGTQAGKMIAYKEAKKAPEAAKAQKAASDQLRTVGTKVKRETAVAQNPELQVAGATSAAKFTQSATDARFFDRVKSTKDLNRAIDAKMTDWLNPVAGYCAT
jgi:hypothetical protein